MKKLLALILLSTVFFSCGKNDTSDGYIPYVNVNIRITKGDPRFNAINVVGGSTTYPGGVSGVVIYNNGNSIVAFDRCSSYQPEKLCAVVPDENLPTATDPCSGSKFSLSDGSPVKAPAKRSLRQYTVIQTQFEIQIVN